MGGILESGRGFYCKRFRIWIWFGESDMWISFLGEGFVRGKGWGVWDVDKVVDRWVDLGEVY